MKHHCNEDDEHVNTMSSKMSQYTSDTCGSLDFGTFVCCNTCKKWFQGYCQQANESDLKKHCLHLKQITPLEDYFS